MTIAILGFKGQIGSALFRRLSSIFSCEEITRIKLDCSNIRKLDSSSKDKNGVYLKDAEVFLK